MALTQTEVDALQKLVDQCSGDPSGEQVSQLIEHINGSVTPILNSSDEQPFRILVNAAGLVASLGHAAQSKISINFLLDVAFAHIPRGQSAEGIGLAEHALEFAARKGDNNELRRAYSVSSVLYSDLGLPSRGAEHALRATAIAQEMKFEFGVAAALCNLTAALFAMGMYRESIYVASRVAKRFEHAPDCAISIGAAMGNMAGAALALHDYSLAAESAEIACKVLGAPQDAQGILNRLAAEIAWLNSVIGLNHKEAVFSRRAAIHEFAGSLDLPRFDIIRKLAEASVKVYLDDLVSAIPALLTVKHATSNLPTLYRDCLAILIRAYELNNDHANAFIYLSELVEMLGHSQITKISAFIDSLREKEHTVVLGKADAAPFLASLDRPRAANSAKTQVPEAALRDAFERLAMTAEMREDPSGLHMYRVGRMAYFLAETLGHDASFCTTVEHAARLHDIGKLGLPDEVLMKTGKLNRAHRKAMQKHSELGANMVSQANHPAFDVAQQVVRHHHEHWDGSGYPDGLKGDTIPEAARIAAIAEVYDVLTQGRSYRPACTPLAALAIMQAASGTQFDPQMVQVFSELLEHLLKKHGEQLSDVLALPGRESSFLQAKNEMANLLDSL